MEGDGLEKNILSIANDDDDCLSVYKCIESR